MGAGWGGSIYSNICECRLSGAMHPIRIELCGRPVLIILWIEHVRSSVYCAEVQFGFIATTGSCRTRVQRSG